MVLRMGVPLSLTGRHARFGRQAALGLEIWGSFEESVELVVEDDRSDPEVLEKVLRGLSARCDLLLGPYSTGLMRRAGRVAVELDRLVWNHGGAGETSRPGHVVSVLTPAVRYAEPFVRRLGRDPLWVVAGRGSFGRQVAMGAETCANRLGIPVTRERPRGGTWNLMCAGSFEEDVEVVERTRVPGEVCAVAAGVREFGQAVGDPSGIYGVGQWYPGTGSGAAIGIPEPDFLAAYLARAGAPPDYPAVQAAATAIIATHCAAKGSTDRAALWSAAAALETTTLFGAFRIDPRTGTQIAHRTSLIRWTYETGVA